MLQWQEIFNKKILYIFIFCRLIKIMKVPIIKHWLKWSKSIIDFLEKLWFSLSDFFWVCFSRNGIDEFLNFLYYWACFHPFWLSEFYWHSSILLFSLKFLNFPPWSDWLSQRQGVLLRENVLSKFQWSSMNQLDTAAYFLQSFNYIFTCIINF